MLRAYISPFPLRAMICLPCLFVPPVGFICILTNFAYMSMHESCLLVCRPCFNTMKLWTSDPNLNLSLVDTTFFFAFSLVCLLACLLALLFLCLPCLPCLSTLCIFICSLHLFLLLLVCWLLVFAFACTHMEQGHIELGHDHPGTSKRGADANMSV